MKKRILGAIIILIVLIPTFIIGGNLFIFVDAMLALLAYKEITSLNKNLPNLVIGLGSISLIFIIFINCYKYLFIKGISYLPLGFTFIALLLPTLFSKTNKNYSTNDAFKLIGYVIFLGIAFSSFNLYMLSNKNILLFLIITCWVNDATAYLIGKNFGHQKFSAISPHKTVLGTIAGMIGGFVGGFIYYLMFVNIHVNLLYLIILCLILNMASFSGDLLFSKIKRENNIKDFSNIIPGHGGILDRLDSLILTSIAYLFITTFI